MLLRKVVISFCFFLGFCAIFALVGGVISYSLTDAAAPEVRRTAAESLVASWGSAYPAGIMLASAILTVLGLVTKRLPGMKPESSDESPVIVK